MSSNKKSVSRTKDKKKTKSLNKMRKSNNNTRKYHKTIKSKITKSIFTTKHYSSGDGFLTSVWGPPAWFFLHTISFNYPVNPTKQNKKDYKEFIHSLQNVLPCGHCRENLKNNLKIMPLTNDVMESRDTFSRYLFNLHELVNKRLDKKSGITYEAVRDRYEHFRSRCTLDTIGGKTTSNLNIQGVGADANSSNTKEKGCVEPLYGKKSKCLLKIVPQEQKGDTIEIDSKCLKHTKS